MLLRTIFVWAFGLPLTLFIFILVLLSLLVERQGRLIHRIGALWSRILLLLSGVRVKIKGLENIPSGPVIFLSNHQGAFDIPALQAYLPKQFRWVAKKSLFKIPVVGWSMSLAGYIKVDREHGHKAMQSLEEAAGKVKAGTSVLIFPEGTRSSSGELLAFKRGAFMLASLSRVPVVPIGIRGTNRVMKKGSLRIRPADVTVNIGKPIVTEGLGDRELRAKTRKEIEELLNE